MARRTRVMGLVVEGRADRVKKKTICGVMLGLLMALAPGAAWADHEDGWYELPALDMWTKAELVVFIVPPAHGQLVNDGGVLGGPDPNEATPFNSYLAAVEDSIKEWNRGIKKFGSRYLRSTFKARVYVLGRDEVPQDVTEPDILVVTDESKGPILGFALRSDPCIVNNSKIYLSSFSYADMYNVNAQEYGHCLGLGHVGSQGGTEPTSEQKHPEHDVMNGFYADTPGSNMTHLHCVSNLDVKGLEYTFRMLTGGFGGYTAMMRVERYRTTCGGDGRMSPEHPWSPTRVSH